MRRKGKFCCYIRILKKNALLLLLDYIFFPGFSWCSPKVEKYIFNEPKQTSTPNRNLNINKDELPVHAVPKSWFRITGANSPRQSLQTYRTNISFNL